ncbi:polysaccharide export protein [Altererythrobacter sp. RZ02]|uniref:Polysaccharide export protein n=1 Tax=Pontixanthobacter rizhaonensis TaxID=2730337 RepID=A0A848QU17_9SPHN|nr:polysaccharide biosynthesis/export family protein [Pontixanthobacter rizhaonensis]NMW32588.1 polysaccharide export protein [Pontixanthobacter rizhaonensis]
MRTFFRAFLASLVLSVGLTGCASGSVMTGAAPSITLTTLSELPAPSKATAYTIDPLQKLQIEVADVPLLSGNFLTDEEGYISYPLVGDLLLAGKTPNQAARMISDRLRGDYVVDPQVRVLPQAEVLQSVSVGGEVAKPGSYTATEAATLLRAVNSAGGLSDLAKLDDVLVLRTVDDQDYIGVYNIQAIQRGNYPDPAIYPGDIVTVGDSVARKRVDSILQFVPLLSSSILLLNTIVR